MRRLLLTLPFLAACSMGPRVERFAPIRDPQGALARVQRGRAGFNAELLAVTDSALLLVSTDSARVVLAPYNAATTVSFPELPLSYRLRAGRPPADRVREQLRLWSRFPSGVDPVLLRRLLAAYGQDSLQVLAPCASRRC